MPVKVAEPPAPRGLLRLALRLPVWLYRAHLGWLLKGRFLLLTHTGRVSGKARQTVLEVVRHDREGDVYYVASGWGARSDWYRNLMKTPEAVVQVGRRKMDVVARQLSPDEAAQVIMDYARRSPRALRAMARFMGYRLEADEADYRAFGRLVLVVALVPRGERGTEGKETFADR